MHKIWDELWAAMNATSGTPFVFVAQDDVLMFRTINVSGITWRLQHDTSVRYVKLFNYDHLDARVQSWNRPAKPHPTDPTLFSLRRFSDRPHFAHRAIYTDEVCDDDISPALLALADKYDLPILFNKCERR